MDERRSLGHPGARKQSSDSLSDKRREGEKLLTEDLALLDGLERSLSQHLDCISGQLDERFDACRRLEEEQERRRAEVEAEAARLHERRQQLVETERAAAEAHERVAAANHAIVERLEARLAEFELRLAQVQSTERGIEERQRTLATGEQQLAAERQHLDDLRKRLTEHNIELENERAKLAGVRSETDSQRRRVGRKFKAQRTAHAAELARRRAELESLASRDMGELETQREAAVREAEKLRQESAHRGNLLEIHGAEIAQVREDLARALVDLEAARTQLAMRESAWQAERQQLSMEVREGRQLDAEREEIAHKQAELESADRQLRAAKQALAGTEQDLASERDQVERLRASLGEQLAKTERERELFEAERAKTKTQRRHAAQQLKAERIKQEAELSRRKAEIDRFSETGKSDLEEQLATVDADSAELRKQNAQLRKVLNDRADQLNEQREHVQSLTAEIEHLGKEHDRLTQELALRASLASNNKGELATIVDERNDLARRLTEAESNARNHDDEASRAKTEYLQQRFEMAVEEVRELKRRNTELESKLTQSRASGPGGPVVQSGRLDWESQKRRLLASLEADSDGTDGKNPSRMTIEGTIRITDEVVARKDLEIAELKQRLEAGALATGLQAADAARVAEVLDKDELVRAEREKLEKLQEQWHDTLRKAEIDLSVERAKIARDRAEIEEKLQTLEAQQAQFVPGESNSSEPRTKLPRGRWLTRLGLKDLDQ